MKTRTRVSKDSEVENTGRCESKDDSVSNYCEEDSAVSKESKPFNFSTGSHGTSKRKSNKEKANRNSTRYKSAGSVKEQICNAKNSFVAAENNCGSSAEINHTDLNSDPRLSKNPSGKKGRNLDLVVRRMLRAKKEDEKRTISCEASEIKSSVLEINSIGGGRSSVSEIDKQAGENESKHERRDKRDDRAAEGMIDVQCSVESKAALHDTSGGLTENGRESQVLSRLTESCSSPEFSPLSNSSDNEGLKPFVRSQGSASEEQKNSATKSEMTMSALIKQEPLGLTETRTEIYHRGREQSHSPASSYSSVPSIGQRSPGPKSPLEQHEEGQTNTDLLINPMMRQLASQNALSMINSSGVQHLTQEMLDAAVRYSRRTSTGGSPQPEPPSRQYPDEISGIATAALAAKGVGPPTLVPSSSAIPSSESFNHLLLRGHAGYRNSNCYQNPYAPSHRDGNNTAGIRVSPTAPMGRTPTRGIVGHKEAAAAAGEEQSGRRNNGNTDEKCSYKRPPHTYPALIASAILDSPGNLITLRGIYDYIMNNFPYYKFGHDKSAWQNSIRHNLSLNQCFIKVPRYENAAKSNYWTMTREGFEEFGNENSFKRRRRRGATLAPISAYKNKKGNNNNDGNRTGKQRSAQDGGVALVGGKAVAKYPDWNSRSRTPEPRLDYQSSRDQTNNSNPQKRPFSPNGDSQTGTGGKNPRMMILKQGEGPALEGISYRGDQQPQRPNSLSSVEEMQVNVNSFSKSLSAANENNLREASRNASHHVDRNSPMESLKQQWMMAAMQKNFNLFPPGMIPDLNSTVSAAVSSQERYAMEAGDGKLSASNPTRAGLRIPVLFDGVEIGTRTAICYDSVSSGSKWSFECKFCEFKNIDNNQCLLEQHCQSLHQMELPNMRAKIAAAAAVSSRLASEHNAERKSPPGRQERSNGSPLASMGWPPSLLAAAASYSNAQNFIAAAQGSGLNLPISAPYSDSYSGATAATPFDTLTRALAQQLSPSDAARSSPESLRRRTMPGGNDIIQQAATFTKSGDLSSMTQEHFRQLLYQQLLPQNPFFPGSNAPLSRPVTSAGPSNDMSDLAQKFWLYHQKVLELAAENATEKQEANESNDASRKTASKNQTPTQDREISPEHGRVGDHVESLKTNANEHDCQCRDETAKDYRTLRHQDSTDRTTPELQSVNTKSSKTAKGSVSPNLSSAENESATNESVNKIPSTVNRVDCSTQTAGEDGRRICIYCDLTFGDDTMHALHMSCHDRNDPFRCTICGQDCHEKYYFNVHLLRGLHQPATGAGNESRSRSDHDNSVPPSRDGDNESTHAKSETTPEPFVSNGVCEKLEN